MLTDLSDDVLAINATAADRGLNAYASNYVGAWAIQDAALRTHIALAERLNLNVHLRDQSGPQAAVSTSARSMQPYQVTSDGVAVVGLSGTLMKHVSSFADGTSTVMARRQLRAAARDPEVRAILLVGDTPGGTVAGTHDLGADIRAAADVKPLHAYGEDLVASAGYWALSQASRFTAGPTSIVGSIGALHVIHDLSQMADKEGIKVHVVKFGAHKGAAVAGTEVTEEQLTRFQELVDSFGADFVTAVAQGRGVSEARAREWADGRIHKATEAVEMGLLDATESLDEALENLRSAASAGGTRRNPAEASSAVSTTQDTDKPEAAKSFEEQLAERKAAIQAACVGADEQFVASQVAAGVSPEAAAKAWMTQLAAERDEALKAKASDAKSGGCDPLADGPGADDTGASAAGFEELVAKHEQRGKPRAKAVAAAVKESPESHRAYVHAANAAAGRSTSHFDALHGS